MEFTKLNTGALFPLIGLGTWQLKGESGKEAILSALEMGYRLIDTAQMYGNEELVAQAIKESNIPREEIFLTTKLYGKSNSFEKAMKDINLSLETLQTDYIDLLLIHEPYKESLSMYEALKEAQIQGKVRAIGISNFNEEEYFSFVAACGRIPSVNQVESHVFRPQLSLQETLSSLGTVMQSWAPFAEGQGNIFENPILTSIGNQYGKTAAQVALRYLIEMKIPVIPKSVHKERLKENIEIFDFSLTKEEKEQIATLDQNQSFFGW